MILVTGATGNVGGEVVTQLAQAGVAVRAVARDPGLTMVPDAVEVAGGDLSRPDSLSAALDGVSGVFLLGGFADMPGLLAAIRTAGAERVVLLSSRCVVGGDPENAITRMWLESEAAVRDGGVPATVLRPSGFMANALRWRPQLADSDVVAAPWPDVAVAEIDPADIAAVAVKALTEDGHAGTAPMLTGPRATVPAERVRVLAEVLGRDLRYEPQSDAAARAEMEGSVPADTIDGFFRFFSGGEFDDSSVTPEVEALLGRPPRTLEQWARAHAAAFR